MRQTNPVNNTAFRVVGALILCLWFAFPASSNADKDRKNAAKSLAKEIERAQLHKIYVADFLGPSGTRTEKGCFFASTFSTNLAKGALNFTVINRIQAQKQLNELHISAQDLQQPEVIAKAALALGVDAILAGSASISPKEARLFLSLRDATSGKEVHSIGYNEKREPALESSFPAVEDPNSHIFYFPGLDGVSQPKCIYCPDPDYTDEARRNRIEGSVLLSVAIDENGAITDVRVMKNPDNDLTKRSLNILKKWRMEPSHDANGKAVPVRAPIEIGFRLLR